MSAEAFVGEVMARRLKKRDFMVPTSNLQYDADECAITWENGSTHMFELNNVSTQNLCSILDEPKRFFDAMTRNEHPTVVKAHQNLVNDILLTKRNERRLIRCYEEPIEEDGSFQPEGACRAILSDKYRRIDNEEVMEVVAGALELNSVKNWYMETGDLTDRKMYLRLLSDRLRGDVAVGDAVQMGVMITNSEVGEGSFRMEPLLYRLSCLNGMVINDARFRKNHVSARNSGDGIEDLLKDETKSLMNKAFLAQLKDVVEAMCNQDTFNNIIQQAKNGMELSFKEPMDAVTEVTKRYELDKDESKALLQSFLGNSDYSLWGMANAMTNIAHIAQPDRRYELQKLGHTILSTTSLVAA
jgi:hypothetical protein